MAAPYKGLMPYAEDDAPFFFGREGEREIITANLLAAGLTLVYGASGVGKSSVLRAGVAAHLRRQAHANVQALGAPESVVVLFSAWRDDPIAGLAEQVRESVARTLNGLAAEPPPASPALTDTLAAWTERIDGDLLIILDQFEEYFLYHGQEDGPGSFAVEFPRALSRRDLRASFLVAIREDALAKLDRFKGRIPNLFDNYLRIEHLDRAAARAAIERPLEAYNRLNGEGPRVRIEPALVDAVLDQVKVGRVVVGEAGRGAVDGAAGAAAADERIETPYLQLVMTRLWEEETAGEGRWVGERTLRLATLERLGGAERIVRTHLDAAMGALPAGERRVAARVFHYLVTASGTKIAHTAADLADYAALPAARVAPVLETLAGGEVRILRPVPPPVDQPGAPRYEIFHDVLAPAILDWRAREAQEQEREAARDQLARERRRVNRLRLGVAALSVLVLLMVGLVVFAFQQRASAARARREADSQKAEAVAQRDAADKARTEAQTQQGIAVSRELAAGAVTQGRTDPELGVLLAAEAVKAAPTDQAVEALRRSLLGLRVRAVLRGHTDAVQTAAISPDGRLVLTAGTDGAARLWAAATGAAVAELRGHTGGLNGAAFSPDGSLAVTAGDDRTARVWEVGTGRQVAELRGHAASVRTAAFSPGGERAVTASWDGTARVWDARTGTLVAELRGHAGVVHTAAFSPDGALVVTAGGDGTARVWDARTGAGIAALRGHGGPVRTAAFSPDGTRVVTASDDRSARLWEARTGRQVAELNRHTGRVWSAAFSADGSLIVTAGEDRTAVVWDARTGTAAGELRGHGDAVLRALFSPDGVFVATASSDGTARVWETRTGRNVSLLAGHTARVLGVAFSPDGRQVVTASQDGSARLWEVAGDGDVTELHGHTHNVNYVAYSRDGRLLVTASTDGTARVWDTLAGRDLAVLRGHSDVVQTAAFSPDGTRIVTASNDRTVRVWDTATGQELLVLAGHANWVFSAAFSPDGTRIVTASNDRTVRLWDAATGQQLRSFAEAAHTAAFSPDGSRMLLATSDGAAHIWNITTGGLTTVLRGSRSAMWGAAYSPDGNQVVTAGGDGVARLWDIGSEREVASLRGHTGTVYRAAFSPDGTRIVTAGEDHTARVWEAATGRQLASLSGQTALVYGAAFSPDGKSVATASWDRTARIYPLDLFTPVDDLVAQAGRRAGRDLTADERELYLHEGRPGSAAADAPVSSSDVVSQGWSLLGDEHYEVGMNGADTPTGAGSRYIKAKAPQTLPPGALGTLLRRRPAGEYRGRRLRMTGQARADHVGGRGGLYLRVLGPHGAVLGIDAMRNRPITGTGDWTAYALVLDVPEDATEIEYGAALAGAGRLLLDGLRFDTVGSDVPATDHSFGGWSVTGSDPQDYDLGFDPATMRDGRPARSVKSKVPDPRTFASIATSLDARDYKDKRVQLSFWVKADNVEGWAGVWLRVDGPGSRTLAFDNMQTSNRAVQGTSEWKRYETVLPVAFDAVRVVYGLLVAGTGQAWVDDVQIELVGDDVPVTATR